MRPTREPVPVPAPAVQVSISVGNAGGAWAATPAPQFHVVSPAPAAPTPSLAATPRTKVAGVAHFKGSLRSIDYRTLQHPDVFLPLVAALLVLLLLLAWAP